MEDGSGSHGTNIVRCRTIVKPPKEARPRLRRGRRAPSVAGGRRAGKEERRHPRTEHFGRRAGKGWKPCLQELVLERAERRPETPLPWTPEQRQAGMRPEVEAWAVPECAYGERTYTVARPAFFQTSVLAAEVCAVVGEAALAQALKADMVPAGTGRQCPRHRLGGAGRGLAGSGHGRTAPALLAGRIRRTAIADRAETDVRSPARLPICPARLERSSPPAGTARLSSAEAMGGKG